MTKILTSVSKSKPEIEINLNNNELFSIGQISQQSLTENPYKNIEQIQMLLNSIKTSKFEREEQERKQALELLQAFSTSKSPRLVNNVIVENDSSEEDDQKIRLKTMKMKSTEKSEKLSIGCSSNSSEVKIEKSKLISLSKLNSNSTKDQLK